MGQITSKQYRHLLTLNLCICVSCVQMSMFDEHKIIQVIDPENPKIRYGLSKNPMRGQKDNATRQILIEKTEDALKKIAALKRPSDDATTGVRVGKIINKYNVGKLQAFRNLKTVQLEIRPIYHKTDDRIKCHVFLCMLSYYLMWNAKQRLTPLFEADQEGQNKKYTFEHIIERLKSIRKETVEIEGIATKVITECDEEQQIILNHLNVKMK